MRPDFVCALSAQPAPTIAGEHGQWLLLGDEQGPLAWFVLNDRLRDDAPQLIDMAKAKGWQIMLAVRRQLAHGR